MPWQLQPLIWPIVIATLALLSVPHKARPAEPSAAVRRACVGDVKRLCPAEYAARDAAGIGECMKKAGPLRISLKCQSAWIKEHGLKK